MKITSTKLYYIGTLILLTGVFGFGQTIIQGSVLDESDNPLLGATVTLTDL